MLVTSDFSVSYPLRFLLFFHRFLTNPCDTSGDANMERNIEVRTLAERITAAATTVKPVRPMPYTKRFGGHSAASAMMDMVEA